MLFGFHSGPDGFCIEAIAANRYLLQRDYIKGERDSKL
jgi:hypothetical protein